MQNLDNLCFAWINAATACSDWDAPSDGQELISSYITFDIQSPTYPSTRISHALCVPSPDVPCVCLKIAFSSIRRVSFFIEGIKPRAH